jgi:beta-lactamase class D
MGRSGCASKEGIDLTHAKSKKDSAERVHPNVTFQLADELCNFCSTILLHEKSDSSVEVVKSNMATWHADTTIFL